MKKLVIFAVAAVAMASAQAATYWTLLMTEGVAPVSEANGYLAYYCTKAQAATFFDGNDTYDKVAAYLTESQENYDTGWGNLKAGGVKLDEYGQYGTKMAYSKYFDTALDGDYIAVISYASASADADKAQVRVFGNTAANGSLRLDPASSLGGDASSWATVPEPTSGMLLLLGFAALSLRRKRVVSC